MAPTSAGRRPAAGGSKPSARRSSPLPFSTSVLLASLLALTLIVHRQALQAFFVPDDLILFQQAHGIRPWPLTLWRWLSGWAWFRVVLPLWGTEPFPYHGASLVIHAANTALLFLLARRWGAGRLAAWVGAALFALSRLHYPALLAITSIGELFALTGLLAAFLLAGARRRDAAALIGLVLALSAKESVLLVPLAVLLVGEPRVPFAERLRKHARFLATSLVAGGVLLAAGMASGRLGGAAYAVAFGGNLLENLARLASWSVDVVDPIPDLHAATEGPTRFIVSGLALFLSALAFRPGCPPLLRAGVAWWWLAVLPVLPLPGRTYLHYLYVPLAGLGLAAAAGLEALFRRRARGEPEPGRLAWGLALAGILAYAAWSDVLLSLRLDLRMSGVDWPLDPVHRKSVMAERAILDVRNALGGTRAHVVILIPASISRDVDLGSGRVLAESPVRRYALADVLDGGRSLQALVPGIDSVAIVHDHEPGRTGWRYFLSRGDSHLVSLGVLPEAHARFVEAMFASGLPDAARDYLGKALAERPGDPALRALLERLGQAPAR